MQTARVIVMHRGDDDLRHRLGLQPQRLQSLAAERAAEIGYKEPELADLAATIAEMDGAIADEDLAAWAEADERFHAELMRLGAIRVSP